MLSLWKDLTKMAVCGPWGFRGHPLHLVSQGRDVVGRAGVEATLGGHGAQERPPLEHPAPPVCPWGSQVGGGPGSGPLAEAPFPALGATREIGGGGHSSTHSPAWRLS